MRKLDPQLIAKTSQRGRSGVAEMLVESASTASQHLFLSLLRVLQESIAKIGAGLLLTLPLKN
jgi:hypothetical protein